MLVVNLIVGLTYSCRTRNDRYSCPHIIPGSCLNYYSRFEPSPVIQFVSQPLSLCSASYLSYISHHGHRDPIATQLEPYYSALPFCLFIDYLILCTFCEVLFPLSSPYYARPFQGDAEHATIAIIISSDFPSFSIPPRFFDRTSSTTTMQCSSSGLQASPKMHMPWSMYHSSRVFIMRSRPPCALRAQACVELLMSIFI